MTVRDRSRMRRGRGGTGRRPFRPLAEAMEVRALLSYADGNGAIVTSLAEQAVGGRSQVVLTFDGPLDPASARDPANYRVNALARGNLEVTTTAGPAAPILSASLNPATNQVALTLKDPLKAGLCARVFLNGSPTGVKDASGNLVDGDDDDTAGGNFFGLIATGKSLSYSDSSGDRVTLAVSGGGTLELWRLIDGDASQLTILGAVPGRTTLTGSVKPAKGSDGQVVIPSIVGLDGVNNLLPPSFVSQAIPAASPTPVVATPSNLPYTIQIQQVNMPTLPTLQSAVSAQSGGYWLLFGGRTNGLHGFNPTGLANFPPIYQNNDIIVIDPATGQTWSEPWSATGLPASVTTPLSSVNQDSFQVGDRLYTIGGYSLDPATGDFETYDTLTAISVRGLIDAVIDGGDVASQIKQIADPRLRNTGGELDNIGSRSYLVFGQSFQGSYNGNNSSGTQIYSDEVRSFRIVDRGDTLAITNYAAQRDPVNFRRRDYNLIPVVFPDGKTGLEALGGVFTPDGNGYRNPIVIGTGGIARVDPSYQQYFSQYTAPTVPLYDARTGTMATVLFGGISLYDYNLATGTLTADTNLPFVDDVTSLVTRPDGSTQEYVMPSQLPGFYGAEAAFFPTPGLPAYSNGVLKLDQLSGPTTLGYIYGGIYSTVTNTFAPYDPSTQTTATNAVFQVTLVPA